MKRIIGLVFLVCLLISSKAQFADSVELNPTFYNSGLGIVISTMGFYSKQVKSEEPDCQIYELRHDYQAINKVYKKYLDGIIDIDAFNRLFRQLQSDSFELSTLNIDSEISLLIKVYKNGLVRLIPDENNNNSYSDDRSIEYYISKDSGGGAQKRVAGSSIDFRFENIHSSYLGKDTVFERQFSMSLQTDSFDISKIRFFSYQDRKGVVKINDKKYSLKVSYDPFRFLQARGSFWYVLKNYDDSDMKSQEFKRSRDTFYLNDILFVANSRNPEGSIVRYEWLNEPQHIGFLEGSYIPDISLGRLLSKSKETSIRDYQGGDYLLVDFFGSWCLPCIENLPALKNLVASYSGKKLKVLGVGYEFTNDYTALTKLIENEKLTWPVVKTHRNQLNSIVKYANIYTFPTYLLISPKGKVLFSGSVADFPRFQKILATELNQ